MTDLLQQLAQRRAAADQASAAEREAARATFWRAVTVVLDGDDGDGPSLDAIAHALDVLDLEPPAIAAAADRVRALHNLADADPDAAAAQVAQARDDVAAAESGLAAAKEAVAAAEAVLAGAQRRLDMAGEQVKYATRCRADLPRRAGELRSDGCPDDLLPDMPAAQPAPPMVTVMATEVAFVGGVMRRPGEVFEVPGDQVGGPVVRTGDAGPAQRMRWRCKVLRNHLLDGRPCHVGEEIVVDRRPECEFLKVLGPVHEVVPAAPPAPAARFEPFPEPAIEPVPQDYDLFAGEGGGA